MSRVSPIHNVPNPSDNIPITYPGSMFHWTYLPYSHNPRTSHHPLLCADSNLEQDIIISRSSLFLKRNLGLGRPDCQLTVTDELLCMVTGCALGTDVHVCHWMCTQKPTWFKVNTVPLLTLCTTFVHFLLFYAPITVHRITKQNFCYTDTDK